MLSFKLSEEFVDSYRSKPEKFGFNGLGNIVFYRTYSRVKENGEYETWTDVCARVINGMYSLLQDHARKNKRRWDSDKAQKDAQEAFDRMFNFKWTPSGRGLWMMGTPFIHERKTSEALLNCAFIGTENIKQEGGEIFEWIANMLMLGVGVAFDTKGAGEVLVSSPRNSASTYLVDDSREGWARSIKVLVNSYLDGTDVALFDYSMVRKKGEPIKGFGGVASGPEPLMLCHDRIREYMNKNVGKKITSRTITDICNAIGACVVAGNVRRCLPYYANVQTSDGYKRIENIKEGDIVVTGGISNKVVAKIYSGEQQLIHINHRFGTLKCTPNHEIAIFNSLDQYEFKQASDIKAGDRLVFDKMGITNNNREIALPSFDSKHFNTKQEEKYPTILTEEIAWAIGAIQGDGTVSGDEISIYQEPKYINVLKEMNQVFLESFGRYSPIREHNDGYRWRISSAVISKWFNQHIKTSSTKLMVPEIIKTSSQMSRAAYLAGLLDTDGCVKRNSVICAVTTIYEDFARDIVSLLASLGIAAKVNHSQKITFNEKLVDAYDVTISGVTNKKRYDMLVGEFSVSDKLDKLSNHGHIDFSYPKSILKQDDMLGGYLSDWTDGVNYTHLNTKTSYLPTEVLSVELSDEIVPTYDIEVENVHQFTTDGIVVHNSAELALGEADDQDYIALKNYSLEENKYRQEIGWASNNSIIGDGVKQYGAIAENIRNNGEPGVVWLENIERYGRMGEEKHDNAIGVNPCFTGDTMVQTSKGHYPISDLVGKNVKIWNGENWQEINTFRQTGEGVDVLKITLHDGSVIRVTPYHKFILSDGTRVEAKDLEIGKSLKITDSSLTHGPKEIDGAYIKGFLMGDGTLKRDVPHLYLYSEKYSCEERLTESLMELPCEKYGSYEKYDIEFSAPYKTNRVTSTRKVMKGLSPRRKTIIEYMNKSRIPQEMFAATYYSKLEFLAGLFDSDGTASDTNKGFMYQISSVHKEMLLDLQLLLKTIDIQSTVRTTKASGETDFNDGYGIYETKELHRLTISQRGSIAFAKQVKFSRLTSFADRVIAYHLKPKWNVIEKIEFDGQEDVYCCTVEGNHQFSLTCGLDVGQCSEIPLASREECNLSEIYMQNMDDEYDFQRTIKFAYLYSKAITLTYEWITDSKSRKIMMKNRRVGVGTTGIAQFLGKHSVEDLVGWWDRGYKLIQSYDDRYSQWLGIPKSIRTTTIKPSGTVSLLAGATPGIHYPHDNFYIRRVRIQDDTPMLTALQYAGYKIEKDVYSANTSVIEIPIKVEGETSKNKTLWEQLQLASLAQRYWSDNSVSVTISFKPSDVTSEEIANAISLYAGELKCVSMLPITEEGQYEQMPYESITKEKYEEMIGDITPIANLAEHMSIVNKMKDLYCENDSCVIK